MGKKKDSMALFEVISKSRQRRTAADLNVPRWMAGGEGAQDADEAQAEPKTPGAAPTVGRSEPAPRERPSGVETRYASVTAEPGRLHLSVTYVTAGFVAAALVILLLGAFWLGRATGGSDGAAVQAGTGAPPLRPEAAEGVAGSTNAPRPSAAGAPAAGTEAPAAQRTPGKFYLVIQNLLGSGPEQERAAFEIQDFCRAHGEPATVNLYKGKVIVWSLTPFDSPNSTAALAYGRKIEKLGQQYQQQGGRYDFRQRRDGQFDPLFLLYRE